MTSRCEKFISGRSPEVQNGNQREVMTKCGNFFKPEKTKCREDSVWVPTSEKTVCSLAVRESLRIAFCYKNCFRRAAPSACLSTARRLGDCRGSRARCEKTSSPKCRRHASSLPFCRPLVFFFFTSAGPTRLRRLLIWAKKLRGFTACFPRRVFGDRVAAQRVPDLSCSSWLESFL